MQERVRPVGAVAGEVDPPVEDATPVVLRDDDGVHRAVGVVDDVLDVGDVVTAAPPGDRPHRGGGV